MNVNCWLRVAQLFVSSSHHDRPSFSFSQGTKAEWLLSLSVEQMSRLKALEELGVSQAMLEEDRGRILGDLGIPRWGNPGDSMVDAEQDSSTSAYGPVFRKRQHIEATAKRWGLAQPTRQIEVRTF